MDDACAYLEANGFVEVTAVLSADGARSVVYHDTPALIGSMVDLLPMNANREAYYGRVKRTRPVKTADVRIRRPGEPEHRSAGVKLSLGRRDDILRGGV